MVLKISRAYGIIFVVLKRNELQIQNRIPESDKARGFGSQHIADENKLNQIFRKDYFPFAVNLKSEI